MSGNLGDVFINGGSDGTVIGNTGSRMHVIDDGTAGQIPTQQIVYEEVELLDTGDKDMNVDGSSVNVVYENGPPAGQIWYVYEMSLTINDNGTASYDDFGALNALTNGVLVEQQIDSTDYTFRNFIDNGEVASAFGDHHVRGVANAFINNTNFFTGKVELRSAVTLTGDDGDVIKATVRDDLTGLTRFRMGFEYFRVL